MAILCCTGEISGKDPDIICAVYRAFNRQISYGGPRCDAEEAYVIGSSTGDRHAFDGVSITHKSAFERIGGGADGIPALLRRVRGNPRSQVNVRAKGEVHLRFPSVITHLIQLRRVVDFVRVILCARTRAGKLSRHIRHTG